MVQENQLKKKKNKYIYLKKRKKKTIIEALKVLTTG